MQEDLAFYALAISAINFWYLYAIHTKLEKLNRTVSHSDISQPSNKRVIGSDRILESAQSLILEGKHKEAQKLVVDNTDDIDEIVRMFRALDQKRRERQ